MHKRSKIAAVAWSLVILAVFVVAALFILRSDDCWPDPEPEPVPVDVIDKPIAPATTGDPLPQPETSAPPAPSPAESTGGSVASTGGSVASVGG